MRAFILHRRPYKEHGFLLDLMTDEGCRVTVVAPYAKSKRSSSHSHFQSFIPLWIEYRGQNELRTLVHSESLGVSLMTDTGLRWISALYLNELLFRTLTVHDPHPELFFLYEKTLQTLNSEEHLEWVLRLFEKNLLKWLGYALPLVEDNQGNTFDPNQAYYFEINKGFTAILNSDLKKTMRLYSGGSLISLSEEVLYDLSFLPELKHLLKKALQPLLGDKPLRTQELARQWMQSMSIPPLSHVSEKEKKHA